MNLARRLTLFAFGTYAAWSLPLEGCSSSGASSGGDDVRPAATAPSDLVHPPDPVGTATTSGTSRNFAVDKLFLGWTDRAGNASQDAWQGYGYDLDGKETTEDSTDVCTPHAGDRARQVDGPHGLDNSFGRNVLPLLKYVAPTAEDDINKAITSGAFTLMLDVTGLTDDPGQSATGLSAKLFAGASLGETPSFRTDEDWPVLSASLQNGDVAHPKVQFPGGYVTRGTWVNARGGGGDVSLSLSLAPGTVTLTIHHAIITFAHSAPGDATEGIIAGVLDANELLASLDPVVASLGQCQTFASVALGPLRAAADMSTDGTNAAGKACDGISIGIGFTAKQIAAPSHAAPPVKTGPSGSCASR